jgi:hypothetical protein
MNKESKEYQNGYDAGLNGGNDINSHFGNFSTREQTTEWEAGNRAGLKAKAQQQKGKGVTRKSNPRKK